MFNQRILEWVGSKDFLKMWKHFYFSFVVSNIIIKRNK